MTGTTFSRRLTAGAAAVLVAVAPLLATHPGGVLAQEQPQAEWNISMVGGPAAADGATIAIVDSGVQRDHYAFVDADGSRVLPGIDLVDGDDDPADPNGHGTHVAGIAAGGGIRCEGRAIAIGVAPDADILPVRVLDPSGRGEMADVIAGIEYAVDRGADVINLSLGEAPSLLGLGGGPGPLLDALSAAWDAGSIPVLAAGNSGGLLDTLLFPQGYGDVDAVVVTAVDAGGHRADYAVSARTARWGIAAPGGSASQRIVSSLDRQRCGAMSGTSMAAPHVSGALAVLRSRGLSPQESVDRLLDTARAAGPEAGAGIVDLAAALDGVPDSTPSSTTAPSTTTASTTTTTSTTAPSDDVAETTSTTGATTTIPIGPAESDAGDEPDAAAPTDLPDDGPDDGDGEEASDLTLKRDDEAVPGAAAAVAALGVTLTWLGWLAALRRHFM